MCIHCRTQPLRGRSCSSVGYPYAPVPLRVLLSLEWSTPALVLFLSLSVYCLTFNTFPQRCHRFCCWAQFCPVVCPLWSQLAPAMISVGQPLTSHHRGHMCSPPDPSYQPPAIHTNYSLKKKFVVLLEQKKLNEFYGHFLGKI